MPQRMRHQREKVVSRFTVARRIDAGLCPSFESFEDPENALRVQKVARVEEKDEEIAKQKRSEQMEPRKINGLVLAVGSSRSTFAKQDGDRNRDQHPGKNGKGADLDERNIGDFSGFIGCNRGGIRGRVRDQKPNQTESEGKDRPGNQSAESKGWPRNLDWGGSLRLGCRDNFTN